MKHFSNPLISGRIGFYFFFAIAAILGNPGIGFAQEVQVDVSYDTVYSGNILAVRYSLENWQADMDQADYGEFEVAGGPQISSSMSISGGERKSSKSILIYLRPPTKPGEYFLPPLTFTGEGKKYTTKKTRILVVANPENIQQQPVFTNERPKPVSGPFKKSSPPRGERQRF